MLSPDNYDLDKDWEQNKYYFFKLFE
jgi:hypothetical protein